MTTTVWKNKWNIIHNHMNMDGDDPMARRRTSSFSCFSKLYGQMVGWKRKGESCVGKEWREIDGQEIKSCMCSMINN